ncbi:DNA-binding response regulator [Planomonospora parontospora subsp. parontospora]|uniref:DNA-binding response regulator n=2 Tax=Planomonospora parontospora TaxID=58119 RepID=A0AA37BKK3_9ACTN|nr:response regulator transcription factor [Planomonospora parontospora]GGK86391.1 DNA-binding response regulator [Planomonospora parontospora]GII10848.1 DNA-binding response regulator [Planomonospora parontospora subsp. parontospora]
MTEPEIRVLIADDHKIVRTGLRMILESHGVVVSGEAADGVEAVESARRLRPDIVLLDIEMPRLDGIEVTKLLSQQSLRVVILTSFDSDDYVYAALQNGACGYVLKHGGPALLIEALHAAMAGDALVSPSITVRLLRHLARRTGTAGTFTGEPLTEREKQVLSLLARGQSNDEIARSMVIAPSTVKTHVQSVQRKLGARNRVELAAWAWETGHVE